jgi:hypothetical protein
VVERLVTQEKEDLQLLHLVRHRVKRLQRVLGTTVLTVDCGTDHVLVRLTVGVEANVGDRIATGYHGEEVVEHAGTGAGVRGVGEGVA